MPHQFSITWLHRSHIDDLFLGNHEEMRGSNRINVSECQAMVIFVDDIRRDLSIDDLFENGAHGMLQSIVLQGSNQG